MVLMQALPLMLSLWTSWGMRMNTSARWVFHPPRNQKFQLQSAEHPELCVQPYELRNAQASHIEWGPCSNRFLWDFIPGECCDRFLIRSADNPSLCVHPEGGEAKDNGVKLHLWSNCNTERRIEFWFESDDDGNLYVRDALHDKYVHTVGGHARRGVDMHFWSSRAGRRIQFRLIPVSEEEAEASSHLHAIGRWEPLGFIPSGGRSMSVTIGTETTNSEGSSQSFPLQFRLQCQQVSACSEHHVKWE